MSWDPDLLTHEEIAALLFALTDENAPPDDFGDHAEDLHSALFQLRRLLDGIHAAVSFTYIDGEAARLKARIALKEAAGWPIADGEVARLQELASAQAALPPPK